MVPLSMPLFVGEVWTLQDAHTWGLCSLSTRLWWTISGIHWWHWSPKSLRNPEVVRRQKKFKGEYVTKTPPAPITILPSVKSPTNVQHELVLLSSTAHWQNKIRRKEVPKTKKATNRCTQCKLDSRPDSFTKFVCVGCGYLPLCNPASKRKIKGNCFEKYHRAKKIAIMQGQRELAKQLEELDWCVFVFFLWSAIFVLFANYTR